MTRIMDSIGAWALPLGFLPGIALMVMSTSARLTALTSGGHAPRDSADARLQLHRSEYLALALELLYIGIVVLALTVVVGGVAEGFELFSGRWVIVGLCVTVGLLVWSSFLLVLESRLARRMVGLRCREVDEGAP